MATESVIIREADPRKKHNVVVEFNPGVGTGHYTVEINGTEYADVDENVVDILEATGLYTSEVEVEE